MENKTTAEMMSTSIKLNSGYEMPVLGLGTWQLTGETCEYATRKALELGYRHIDTAEAYENEEQIAKALKGFKRRELFITSKVSPQHYAKKDVLTACRKSLERLKTEYLDLYLVHIYKGNVPISETLEAMGQLVEKQLVRSVGLSNFNVEQIREAMETGAVTISNLQNERHPFYKDADVHEFCQQKKISYTAYSPLARGRVFDYSIMEKIGKKYGKSAAQVSLKWLMQTGDIIIPKASSEKHLIENMQVFDWELSSEDIVSIENLR